MITKLHHEVLSKFYVTVLWGYAPPRFRQIFEDDIEEVVPINEIFISELTAD